MCLCACKINIIYAIHVCIVCAYLNVCIHSCTFVHGCESHMSVFTASTCLFGHVSGIYLGRQCVHFFACSPACQRDDSMLFMYSHMYVIRGSLIPGLLQETKK